MLKNHCVIFIILIISQIILFSDEYVNIVPKQEKNLNPLNVYHGKKAANYIKNKKYDVESYHENGSIVLYYGLRKEWYKINGGRSSSEPHYIYYKLPADNQYKIKSVLILGTYKGNPDTTCFATIEDLNGRLIGKSKNFQYKEFSKNKFMFK